MLSPSDLKKKKIIIISITTFLLLVLAVSMARSNDCKVSDFRSKSPVEATSTGFTKQSACKKALAICVLYSSWPKECRIKQ